MRVLCVQLPERHSDPDKLVVNLLQVLERDFLLNTSSFELIRGQNCWTAKLRLRNEEEAQLFSSGRLIILGSVV